MHSRRYDERRRQAALAQGLPAHASVILGQRNATAGTPIPAGFPWRASLVAAGYACTEDLPAPDADDRDDAARELDDIERVEADLDDDTDTEQLLRALGFPAEDD
ncbi:MAG: hypothetical protein Q8S73_26510 [Deltaproteobacteria bacterium]|nr:hypothetical protein [Myxococcales bacterium]MDP3217688.1 hypothetical protein [Deltaproteobacteria bacterium]